MTLKLGDIVEGFEQNSKSGRILFHQWLEDQRGILFSHPPDFTPVCKSELGLTEKLHGEFAKHNAKAIALSVNPLNSHERLLQDINETQNTKINFPIVADPYRAVSTLYDMIDPGTSAILTVRSLFIIVPRRRCA